jgi:hypothetical protein
MLLPLQDPEFVRAKIVPRMCQDCAKLPLFGITNSITITCKVYGSVILKECY